MLAWIGRHRRTYQDRPGRTALPYGPVRVLRLFREQSRILPDAKRITFMIRVCPRRTRRRRPVDE